MNFAGQLVHLGQVAKRVGEFWAEIPLLRRFQLQQDADLRLTPVRFCVVRQIATLHPTAVIADAGHRRWLHTQRSRQLLRQRQTLPPTYVDFALVHPSFANAFRKP